MAEGNNNHASHGGRSYGGRKPGSGRPGNRGGKGFRPRGNGGESYGDKGFRPRRHDDNGGYRRHDDARHGAGDGERRFHRDGERHYNGERRFHRDGERRYNGDRHYNGDGERRYNGDGERRYGNGGHRNGQGGGNRSFHHGNGQGNRSGFRRNGQHGGDNPRYRDGRRDGFRDQNRPYHQDRQDRRHDGQVRDERREFTPEEKRQYREAKRGEYMSKPRRNSDGTMSFPSQNPYTDRRPGEPKMPKGLEWSMLSKDERERLRGLSKEHAENVGLHILAAYAQEENDPENALAHAKWAAKQASRIDIARETLAFIAYRQGDYKLAMREFRTAYRMNGFLDYLPFIADCERGVGNPKKAIELAMSDDAKYLRGEAKAEMFLVYAGALGDLELWDKAIQIVHTLGRSKGLAGAYRMRAVQAEQYFLDECGRTEQAAALDDLLDRLETQYAEADEDETVDDVIIDHDMEHFTDDELDMLGISEDDAQFAPDDYDDMYGGSEDGYGDESDDAESDDSDDSADAEAGQNPDAEDEASLDGPLADEEELTAKETEEGAESFTDPADQNADDTGEAADEAEDAEPAEADDAQTDEAEALDAAEPAAEAQDE